MCKTIKLGEIISENIWKQRLEKELNFTTKFNIKIKF